MSIDLYVAEQVKEALKGLDCSITTGLYYMSVTTASGTVAFLTSGNAGQLLVRRYGPDGRAKRYINRISVDPGDMAQEVWVAQ